MKTVKVGGVVGEVDDLINQAETAIAEGSDLGDLQKWTSIVCRRLERQLRKRIDSGISTPDEMVDRASEVIQALDTWFDEFKQDMSGKTG
jgi:hypothetical protein